MNAFRRICALILGMALVVAGLLKIMDPAGSGLVVDEYFNFLHLGFLKGVSEFVACTLAFLEGITGVALICGVWRKITAIVSGAMLLFFTMLTAALVVSGSEMECGCFGEAIHLSNGQSLIKNLVFDALWCLAFIPLKNLGKPQKVKYVSFSLASISLVLFLLYSVLSIPLRDYTRFKPGTELDEQPLFFTDAAAVYADSLAMEGKVLAVSVYDLSVFGADKVSRLSDFTSLAEGRGFTPLILTASVPEEAAGLLMNPVLLAQTYFADRRELMTLNRSNGGVTFISDGQIIRKWASRNLPDAEELDAIAQKAPMDYMISSQNRTRALFQGFTLYLFAVLLLL